MSEDQNKNERPGIEELYLLPLKSHVTMDIYKQATSFFLNLSVRRITFQENVIILSNKEFKKGFDCDTSVLYFFIILHSQVDQYQMLLLY